MTIAVEVQSAGSTPPEVHYRWDADTDIFTATLPARGDIAEPSGSVELEGTDGSWLVLDLCGGRVVGVEVALWPQVHCNPLLAAPCEAQSGDVVVPMSATAVTVEVEAPMHAEADAAEQMVYFRIGDRRQARSVRFGSDLLLDVDRQGCLAGLWLLNVPPFPATTPP